MSFGKDLTEHDIERHIKNSNIKTKYRGLLARDIIMPNNKATKFIKFIGFAIAVWILCIVYAVASIGD